MKVTILMVTLLLGASQAEAKQLKRHPGMPPPPQRKAAVPRKVVPLMATVLKVDLEKGSMLIKETKYKVSAETRVRAQRLNNGIVQVAHTVENSSPKSGQRTYDLKRMKIYDAAGFELKLHELTPRLKAGIKIAWSKDPKKTSLEHSRLLDRGDLIVVDPQRKVTTRTIAQVLTPIHHPQIEECRPVQCDSAPAVAPNQAPVGIKPRRR